MNDRFAPLKSPLLTCLGLVVFAVLLIWASRPALSAEVSEKSPVASIGVVADSKPYSFFEGRSTSGFSADILKEIAANSGLEFEFRAGNWPELYAAFLNGELDAIDAISYRENMAEEILFTEPYHIRQTYLMQDDTRPIGNIQSLPDLQDLKVGVVEDVYYRDLLVEQGIDVSTYDSFPSLVRALAFGWVDAIIGPRLSLKYQANIAGLYFLSIAGAAPLGPKAQEDLRIGVRAENPRLFRKIQLGLAAISPTEMRTIENRWLGASATPSEQDSTKPRFSAKQQQWLEQRNRTVTYCIDNNWMPLEGLDSSGNHAGLSAEALRLYSERGDIQFKLIQTESWQESLDAAQDRRCDLLTLAMRTPERARFMNFTTPYLHVPNIILGRIEAPFIENVGDLRNQRVGLVRGYAFSELLKYRYPGLKPVEVEDETEGLKRLQDDDLDGYITTLATAMYHMQELGLADIKVIGRIPADWSLSVATRSDEPILLDIMQKLVDSLTPEERRNLESYWRNIEIEQSVDYRVVWQVLGIALFGASLLFYWNRKLDRVNRQLEGANAALARLSVTDDLTQLGNRSYFDREFRKSFQWCQRNRDGFAIAMVDADLFKGINDTYGHEAGDHCLKALAEKMRHHFRRETDRLARFGGEEFVIFTTYQTAKEIVERLDRFRNAVAEGPTVCEGRDIKLTVSIGLATGIPEPNDSPAHFLRLADQALYSAKQNGRNRLEVRAIRD